MKVYPKGVNVVVNDGGDNIFFPKSAAGIEKQVEGLNTIIGIEYRCFEANEVYRAYSQDITDEAGTPIGTPEQVIDYLTEFVGGVDPNASPETDPVFSASPASSLTAADLSKIGNTKQAYAVSYISTEDHTGTYDSGTNRLTALASESLFVDGKLASGEILLVGCANKVHNGVYQVIDSGSPAVKWVLERVALFNDPSTFLENTVVFATDPNGKNNYNHYYQIRDLGTYINGTTPQTWLFKSQHPVTREYGKIFDATSMPILYEDEYIKIRWEATLGKQQPQFSLKTPYAGSGDIVCNANITGGETESDVRGISGVFTPIVDVWYYFSDDGTRDNSFDLDKFGASIKASVTHETSTTLPIYRVDVSLGSIVKGLFQMTVIKV